LFILINVHSFEIFFDVFMYIIHGGLFISAYCCQAATASLMEGIDKDKHMS
jgi:hypothetical protein